MPRLVQDTSLTTAPLATPKVTRLARQQKELSKQKSEIEKQLKILGPKLLGYVTTEGAEDADGKLRLESDTHMMVKVDGESVSIDEQLLLRNGVLPRIIAKCKKRTPYSYVLVTEKKE